jgi:hypothetical protein
MSCFKGDNFKMFWCKIVYPIAGSFHIDNSTIISNHLQC